MSKKSYLERAVEISTANENCEGDNWGDWVNLCGEADAEIKGMIEAISGMAEVKDKLLEQYKRLVNVERNETGHGSTTFGEYLDMIQVIGMAEFNKKLMKREAK